MTRELELDDIGFSVRNEFRFKSAKITKLKDLLDLSAGNLRRGGFSPSMIVDIRKKLAFHGLTLCGDVLVKSSISVTLTQDIPKMLESIAESVRNLNGILRETIHQIRDLDEKVAQIISSEQYQKGSNDE